MKLYVCWGIWDRATPKPFRRADTHPCGAARAALFQAGYDPQIIRCFGWEALPGICNQTPGRRKVRELTGQLMVPVLVTDKEAVITGSSEIVTWAADNAAL